MILPHHNILPTIKMDDKNMSLQTFLVFCQNKGKRKVGRRKKMIGLFVLCTVKFNVKLIIRKFHLFQIHLKVTIPSCSRGTIVLRAFNWASHGTIDSSQKNITLISFFILHQTENSVSVWSILQTTHTDLMYDLKFFVDVSNSFC